jgi:hypothetical protein
VGEGERDSIGGGGGAGGGGGEDAQEGFGVATLYALISCFSKALASFLSTWRHLS